MIILLSCLVVLAFCSGVWIGVRIEREQTLMWQEHWDGTIREHGFKHRAGGHKQ